MDAERFTFASEFHCPVSEFRCPVSGDEVGDSAKSYSATTQNASRIHERESRRIASGLVSSRPCANGVKTGLRAVFITVLQPGWREAEPKVVPRNRV